MVYAAVADHIVEYNFEPAFLCLIEHPFSVFIGPVTCCHLVIIGDIVSGIEKRRFEKRIDPESVHTETFYIIQFLDDAIQVTDAVSIGIQKCLRINLIKYGIVQIFRSRRNGNLTCQLR